MVTFYVKTCGGCGGGGRGTTRHSAHYIHTRSASCFFHSTKKLERIFFSIIILHTQKKLVRISSCWSFESVKQYRQEFTLLCEVKFLHFPCHFSWHDAMCVVLRNTVLLLCNAPNVKLSLHGMFEQLLHFLSPLLVLLLLSNSMYIHLQKRIKPPLLSIYPDLYLTPSSAQSQLLHYAQWCRQRAREKTNRCSTKNSIIAIVLLTVYPATFIFSVQPHTLLSITAQP